MNALDRIEAALEATTGTGLTPPLTRDTIASLVAVARAAWVLADNIDTYCPCCDSHLEIVTVPLFDDAAKVYAALAPLIEEEEER